MLAAFRTYRLLSAFLAFFLLFAGGLPLVQHACAMAGMMTQEAAHDDCCCDGEMPPPEALPAHAHHGDHAAPPAQPVPCDEAGLQLSAACCSLSATPVRDIGLLAAEHKVAPPLLTTLADDLPSSLTQPEAQEHASLLSTPPRATPLSLHVLHATFLN